jgi:hypothetical protein
MFLRVFWRPHTDWRQVHRARHNPIKRECAGELIAASATVDDRNKPKRSGEQQPQHVAPAWRSRRAQIDVSGDVQGPALSRPDAAGAQAIGARERPKRDSLEIEGMAVRACQSNDRRAKVESLKSEVEMIPGFAAEAALQSRSTSQYQRRVGVDSMGRTGVTPAKEIALMSPRVVRSFCREMGGRSFSAVKGASTYGCVLKDDHGVVCGGVTKDQQNSCSTF